MVWKRCVHVWNLFVYTSLYITAVAMVEAWLAIELLGIEINSALAIIGLITFSVYMNDRIADVDTDSASKPMQAAFIQRHQDVRLVLAAGAYGLAVVGGGVELTNTDRGAMVRIVVPELAKPEPSLTTVE